MTERRRSEVSQTALGFQPPTPESLERDRERRFRERVELAEAYEAGAAELETAARAVAVRTERDRKHSDRLRRAARHLRSEAEWWKEERSETFPI